MASEDGYVKYTWILKCSVICEDQFSIKTILMEEVFFILLDLLEDVTWFVWEFRITDKSVSLSTTLGLRPAGWVWVEYYTFWYLIQ